MNKESVKKFLIDNKKLIDDNNWRQLSIEFNNCDYFTYDTKSIYNIIKKIGVDLHDYPLFKKGDTVSVASPVYFYLNYVNFFNLKPSLKKYEKLFIETSERDIIPNTNTPASILDYYWKPSSELFIYLIDTPYGIYLISQAGLKK